MSAFDAPESIGAFTLEREESEELIYRHPEGPEIRIGFESPGWVVVLNDGANANNPIEVVERLPEAIEVAEERIAGRDARELRRFARQLDEFESSFSSNQIRRATDNQVKGIPAQQLARVFDSIEEIEAASRDELLTVPGVGETTAESLFDTLDMGGQPLTSVPGIGTSRAETFAENGIDTAEAFFEALIETPNDLNIRGIGAGTIAQIAANIDPTRLDPTDYGLEETWQVTSILYYRWDSGRVSEAGAANPLGVPLEEFRELSRFPAADKTSFTTDAGNRVLLQPPDADYFGAGNERTEIDWEFADVETPVDYLGPDVWPVGSPLEMKDYHLWILDDGLQSLRDVWMVTEKVWDKIEGFSTFRPAGAFKMDFGINPGPVDDADFPRPSRIRDETKQVQFWVPPALPTFDEPDEVLETIRDVARDELVGVPSLDLAPDDPETGDDPEAFAEAFPALDDSAVAAIASEFRTIDGFLEADTGTVRSRLENTAGENEWKAALDIDIPVTGKPIGEQRGRPLGVRPEAWTPEDPVYDDEFSRATAEYISQTRPESHVVEATRGGDDFNEIIAKAIGGVGVNDRAKFVLKDEDVVESKGRDAHAEYVRRRVQRLPSPVYEGITELNKRPDEAIDELVAIFESDTREFTEVDQVGPARADDVAAGVETYLQQEDPDPDLTERTVQVGVEPDDPDAEFQNPEVVTRPELRNAESVRSEITNRLVDAVDIDRWMTYDGQLAEVVVSGGDPIEEGGETVAIDGAKRLVEFNYVVDPSDPPLDPETADRPDIEDVPEPTSPSEAQQIDVLIRKGLAVGDFISIDYPGRVEFDAQQDAFQVRFVPSEDYEPVLATDPFKVYSANAGDTNEEFVVKYIDHLRTKLTAQERDRVDFDAVRAFFDLDDDGGDEGGSQPEGPDEPTPQVEPDDSSIEDAETVDELAAEVRRLQEEINRLESELSGQSGGRRQGGRGGGDGGGPSKDLVESLERMLESGGGQVPLEGAARDIFTLIQTTPGVEGPLGRIEQLQAQRGDTTEMTLEEITFGTAIESRIETLVEANVLEEVEPDVYRALVPSQDISQAIRAFRQG